MAQILQPITLTASATLNRKTHAETLVNISAAAGLTITLPASEGKGAKYRIFVRTTVTTNSYIIKVANSTDVMQGAVGISTDTAGVVVLTAATSDTITMNGSTAGGLIGSYVEFTDAVTGFWTTTGMLVSTGSEGDPFSATVS